MKVPVYQQQVDTPTTKLSQAPSPGMNIPSGAFGADEAKIVKEVGSDIAQSISNSGEFVNKILAKRAEQQNEIRNLDLSNQFDKEYQNLLINPDPKATRTIERDGQSYDVPIAVLNTVESQAAGSSEYLEQGYASLYSKYSQLQNSPEFRAKLQAKMASTHSSGREIAMKHEVAQMRLYDKNTANAQINNLQDNAGLDTSKLGDIITEIKDINTKLGARQGDGSDIVKQKNHDDIEKALWSATQSKLESEGLDSAKALLYDQSLKGQIPEDLYKKTEIKLEEAEKRNTALRDWQSKQVTTQGASDLSQNLIDGTLNSDTIQAYQQAGKIDTNTAAIFDAVARKVDFNIPDSSPKGKPDYFLRLLDKGKKSDVASLKVINDATEAYGRGDLGADQYAYFIQEANKRFQRETKGQTGWDKSTDFFRNSAHALNDFAKTISQNTPDKIASNMIEKLVERVRKGEDPTLAAQAIQKETVIEHHPQALTYPIEGRSILDKDGNIKIILPDGTLKDQEKKKEPSVSKGK